MRKVNTEKLEVLRVAFRVSASRGPHPPFRLVGSPRSQSLRETHLRQSCQTPRQDSRFCSNLPLCRETELISHTADYS
jgi:hypothetical protein